MATLNYNQAVKAVKELGIEAQLIPSKSNPKNCQFILIGKDKLKTSQMSGKAIKEALEALVNGCKIKDLQAKNVACNRSNIKELVPFNCSINTTIKEYIKLQLTSSYNTLEAWQNMVIDFYCTDDDGNYNGKIEEAKLKILDILTKEDIIIFKDNYILNKVGINEVIKKWLKYNNKQYTNDLLDSMTDVVIKKLQVA